MAVIAGAIAAAIGIGGAVGTAVVEIGAAIGLSYLAKAITPKPKTSSTRGQSLNLLIATSPNRKVPIGQVGNAGDLTYWQLSGTNSDTLQMIVALGDVECNALVTTAIFVDGTKQTIDGSGFVSGYSSKLKVTFHNGDPGQSADSAVSSVSGGRWTSNEKGQYVCYAVITAQYDEKVFASGIPQIVFVMQGAKLYDWRLDSTNGGSGSQRWDTQSTWTYSDNPIVALYNVIRGIAPGGVPLIGMGVPAAALRLDDFTAAANACDETVSLAAGGTEKRYRLSTVLDTSMTNRDIIETILQSCAGELIESCGIYRPMAGVAQTSVASITDSDLIVTEPFQSDPKRPRTELYNAVYGSYSDPSRGYNDVSLPNRTSSDDEADDGGLRLPQTLDLSMVTSRTQAQRIMEIARKRARRQLIVSCRLRPKWFTLEPGDWITFNSDRRGYSDRTFEVSTIKVNSDLTSDVTLKEVDAGIDDWSTSDELADNTATDLASAGPGLSSVTGLVITTVTLAGDSGSVQHPALAWQWDAIDDPTVISLSVEYRKVGDTNAISDTIQDPTTGGVWVATKGIQGGVTYEGRLNLVTAPSRATDWTSWVTATAATDPQVVNTSEISLGGTPPGVITPEMLDAETQFRIALMTAVDDVFGSVAQQVKDVKDQIKATSEANIRALLSSSQNAANIRLEQTQRLSDSEAFAQQILDLSTTLNGTVAAQITQEITVRSTADTALASEIDTVSSALDDNISTVTVLATSVDGIKSKFTIALSENNEVIGFEDLSGENGEATFTVAAANFFVSSIGDSGGDPVPVFGISTVNGSPKIVFRGDMFGDGSITVNKLNAASIATLIITNLAGTCVLDMKNMRWYRTDGLAKIDILNRTIDFTF